MRPAGDFFFIQLSNTREDGTIIFDILTSGIKQRCSFTEI